MNPSSVLRTVLDWTKVAFIKTHGEDDFSKQHLYAFGKDFLQYLGDEGRTSIDVTSKVQSPVGGKGDRCYLVSKVIDLKALEL